MRAFTYQRVATTQEAAAAVAAHPEAKFIAGGTNLLDLMKLQVETSTRTNSGRFVNLQISTP